MAIKYQLSALGLSKYSKIAFGTAIMTKALWIAVFVFLTNAVPLHRTSTPCSSSQESENTLDTLMLEYSNTLDTAASDHTETDLKLNLQDVQKHLSEMDSSAASDNGNLHEKQRGNSISTDFESTTNRDLNETDKEDVVSTASPKVRSLTVDNDTIWKIQNLVNVNSNPSSDSVVKDTRKPHERHFTSDELTIQPQNVRASPSPSSPIDLEEEIKVKSFDTALGRRPLASLNRRKRGLNIEHVNEEKKKIDSFDHNVGDKVTGREKENEKTSQANEDQRTSSETGSNSGEDIPEASDPGSSSPDQSSSDPPRDTNRRVPSASPSPSPNTIHTEILTSSTTRDPPEVNTFVMLGSEIPKATQDPGDVEQRPETDNAVTSDIKEEEEDEEEEQQEEQEQEQEGGTVEQETGNSDEQEADVVELPDSPHSNSSRLKEFMACEHVPNFYSPRWLYMVTACPEDWTEVSVRERCLAFSVSHTLNLFGLLASLPVQDSHGIVYANEHCAQCHEVESPRPWTGQVNCKASNSMPEIPSTVQGFPDFNRKLNNFFAGPDCERDIQPADESKLRDCQASRTPAGYTPFWAGKYTRQGSRATSGNRDSYGIPFTILFNFDFTGRKNLLFEINSQFQQRYTTKPRCRDWETFDPYKQRCRPVTCSKEYERIDNKCVPSKVGEDSDKYTIDSLSELNVVHQTTLVTIETNVNASARDIRKTDPERSRRALADILEVAVERMENFKLSFSSGHVVGGLNFTYEVLTTKRYQELFPPLPPVAREAAQPAGLESVKDVPTKEIDPLTGNGDENGGGNSTGAQNDDPLSSNGTSAVNNGTKEDITSTLKPNANPAGDYTTSTTGEIHNCTTSGSPAEGGLGESYGDSIEPVNGRQDDAAHKPGDTVKTSYEESSTHGPADTDQVERPVVMKIEFILVPPHNKSENGDSRRLMHAIRDLKHSFLVQMVEGEMRFKQTQEQEQEFADTSQFCPWGIEHRLGGENFTVLEDSQGDPMLYINKTKQFVQVGKFDLFIQMVGDDASDITNVREEGMFAYVCFMPRINQADCTRISLTAAEYTIEGGDKNLVFEGHEYDIFSYSVRNETSGEVQICVPKSFGKGEETMVSNTSWYAVSESCGANFIRVKQAEALITEILGRASLVALCVVLITYILFPRLRNLPGINTMNLTFALLLAEAMFSHGIDAKLPWVCTTVAVCMHYLFLAAHFWMNVMSYDVYRTFVCDVSSSMPIKRVKDKRKYVPLYSLYAWGTPLLIVAFCVVVDKSHLFPQVNIGYGVSMSAVPNTPSHDNTSFSDVPEHPKDKSTVDIRSPSEESGGRTEDVDISFDEEEEGFPVKLKKPNSSPLHGPSQLSYCWITEPLAAFISFGAPILIIFTANCIFFAHVITTISRTARLSRNRLHVTSSTGSNIRKPPGRSDAVLYLRMSTVMGFTWIFGLSSSLVSSFSRPVTFEICIISHILGILFTVFNTSQGIFIFCAFVCNRRVLNLYRALFHRVRLAMIKKNTKSNIYVIHSASTLSSSPEATRQ